MAKLTSDSLNAAPTPFHQWLGQLQGEGRLLRVYTQNIDGLEMKAGLHTYPNLQSDLIPNPSVHCISLHGSLLRLRCQSCNNTFLTETYLHILCHGSLPHCDSCHRASENRMLHGKRKLPLARIRPDIVLYGDTFHPAADYITGVAKQDMKTIDLLLVVGTSLRIPGTRDIVRNFSRQLRAQDSKGRSSIRSVFINMEKVSDGGRAEKYFDAWVEGDCQQFASMVGNSKESRAARKDGSLGAMKHCALIRQDSRPLWRHY